MSRTGLHEALRLLAGDAVVKLQRGAGSPSKPYSVSPC